MTDAAFIKGQVSREWEDFCETGSAFYDYYDFCLCCVGQYLRAQGSEQKAADYLAPDFTGTLLQCGSGNDNPYRNITDPCGVPEHEVASKFPTPFPTATVQLIQDPLDSLSVGVAKTIPLRQLRPGLHSTQAAAAGGDMEMTTQYTPVEHTVTAWVTTTNAEDSHIATVPSTFLTTSMSPLPEQPGVTPPTTTTATAGVAAAAASPVHTPRLTVKAVAGISVGCTVVFLSLLGGLLFWLHRRRRERREEQAGQEAAKTWEEELLQNHSNNRHPSVTSPMSPVTTRGSFCDNCGGEFEKAQLHGESAPTRELSGREVRAPPPPVELPAEPVSKREDGRNKDKERT